MRARLIRGPDPVDFDDFGENSTISRFRFSGSARSLHKNARVNGIFADLWSIDRESVTVMGMRKAILLKSMRFPGLGSVGPSGGPHWGLFFV